MDLGAVLLDGRLFWFCAHLVARQKSMGRVKHVGGHERGLVGKLESWA